MPLAEPDLHVLKTWGISDKVPKKAAAKPSISMLLNEHSKINLTYIFINFIYMKPFFFIHQRRFQSVLDNIKPNFSRHNPSTTLRITYNNQKLNKLLNKNLKFKKGHNSYDLITKYYLCCKLGFYLEKTIEYRSLS